MDLLRFEKLLTAFFLILFLVPAVASAGTLVLLVDMSDSINHHEARYQMDSYVEVLSQLPGLSRYQIEVITYSEGIIHAVKSGTTPEAINFFSGPVIRPSGTLTNLVGPLEYVLSIYDTLPKPVVVDITGDGPHNCNVANGCHEKSYLHKVLDKLEEKGAKVNTLFIGQPRPIGTGGGPMGNEEYILFSRMERNGFSMRATNIMYFELALYEKLTLEMAMLNETSEHSVLD